MLIPRPAAPTMRTRRGDSTAAIFSGRGARTFAALATSTWSACQASVGGLSVPQLPPRASEPRAHTFGLDQAREGLHNDGEAQGDQEDGVDQCSKHLHADPAKGVALGRPFRHLRRETREAPCAWAQTVPLVSARAGASGTPHVRRVRARVREWRRWRRRGRGRRRAYETSRRRGTWTA